MVVPITRIADYINFVNKEAENYTFDVQSFGHAGDGNLHIYTLSNDIEKIEEFKEEVYKFMEVLYEKAYEFGGKLSGEHGIGYGKLKYLRQFEDNLNADLMAGIKKVFDPNLILNPGKVVDL